MVPDLRRRRVELALRAEDLAAELGVHTTSIHRWERRERLPGPVHVVGIARALGLPTSDVARFFDEARPPGEPAPGVRGLGLRTIRAAANIPAAQIARTVGVPTAHVYNWESGKVRIPPRHVSVLAELFQLEQERLRSLLTHPAAPPPAQAPKPVSQGLRRMRRRAGLSQTRVSHLVGVSRHCIGRWERGAAMPPLHAVRRLARLYGVPVSAVAAAAGVEAPPLLDRRTWAAGDLPEALRILREWSGMTQREVALRCACSSAAVRAWENGRSEPRRALRRRLEAMYGLPRDALLRAYGNGRAAVDPRSTRRGSMSSVDLGGLPDIAPMASSTARRATVEKS